MDYTPIENFRDNAGRSFFLAKLGPTLQTCRDMDRLYKIGFGEDLIFSSADHIRMIENGTSYGVFNDS